VSLYQRVQKRIHFAAEQWTNRLCDVCLGIKTDFICEPQVEDELAAAVPFAKRYHATNYVPAWRALRYVRRKYAPETLVDLGCGAGRILALGGLLRFPQLIGVEIDRNLLADADRNLSRFSSRFRRTVQWNLLNISASDFRLPESSCAVFLFNPFDACIMEAFLRGNDTRLQLQDTTFVCANPRTEYLLEALDFEVVHEWRHTDFRRIVRIYRRRGK